MKRKHTLILVVGLLFVTVVGLRLRRSSYESASCLVGDGSPTTRPVSIPEPRDYVLDPQVAPEEVDRGPKRVISLAPSITEILCALGLRDRLVGRTPYSTHPPGIETVESVGALMDTNYARIRALAPDLIFATSNSSKTIADLRQLGLRCEAVPHETLAQVYTAIERIGALCDRPRTAAALVTAIRADMTRLQKYVTQANVRPRRVVVVFGSLPVPPKAVFVAGPGIFLDRLIELAGHTNAARDVLHSSQGEIPLEILRRIDPEVILEFRDETNASTMMDLYSGWAAVGDLQAIRFQRVRAVGGMEWLSAGPRIAIELHQIITVLSEFD